MNQESFRNKPTLFAASGLYLLAALGLWLVALFSDNLIALFPGLSPESAALLANLAYYVPFAVLPVCLYAANRGNAQENLRLNPISFGSMFTASAVALMALLLVQSMTTLWMIVLQKLGFDVFRDSYVRPAGMAELTLSVVSAAIVTPIGEELLFRGAMFSAWERRGRGRAIYATALLFALLHGSVVGLPGEIFGGILMAQLVLWTGSLYAGLAFHSVYNAGGVMMNYYSSAVPDPAADALIQTDIIAYLGGWGTVLVLLVDVVVMMTLIRFLTRPMRVSYTFRRLLLLSDGEKHIISPKEMLEREKRNVEPIPAAALVVLLAGIVSSAGMYLFDIISMLGGMTP